MLIKAQKGLKIMINSIKTGLKPDSVENMVFGAGVLYKNFSYPPIAIPPLFT